VRLTLKSAPQAVPVEVDAWIDTGFTGELMLPKAQISALGVVSAAAVRASLGDGSEVILSTYTCWVSWFGQEREIQAIGSDVRAVLVGVGMLRGRRLEIDYRRGVVTLE
jgi:clan AA aspartic protease